MKTAAMSVHADAEFMRPASSYLRIAIPSWRRVGDVVPKDEEPSVSREEILALFHGELSGPARRKSALTAREEHEKRMSHRLRAALYPSVRVAQ